MGPCLAMARKERPSIDVAEILTDRPGEASDLHHRYLNRQMVRVLKALDFDRTWVRGEGAYLIDAAGDRYLDFLSGYGVFALGRNPPAVRAQLERVLAAGTASLPQLGVTVLPAVLAEELLRRVPRPLGAGVLPNSGNQTVEGGGKLG